jgi:hypothetical protein
MELTWTPKTDPVLMRSSLSARLGQEKPHETQTPQPRADHPQAAQCQSPHAQGRILEQLGCLTRAAAVERAQCNTALEQLLELFPGGLAGMGAESMVSLLDDQGSVGFGDQPVAADQAVAALRKPVERQGATFHWSQRGHNLDGIEVDDRFASVTSTERCGIAGSPLG